MAHIIYTEEAEYGGHRWVCSCGRRGKFVRSKAYAEELGIRHTDKFNRLRDLLKLEP